MEEKESNESSSLLDNMKSSFSRQDDYFFDIDETDIEQELTPNVNDEFSELSESSVDNLGIKIIRYKN